MFRRYNTYLIYYTFVKDGKLIDANANADIHKRDFKRMFRPNKENYNINKFIEETFGQEDVVIKNIVRLR